MESLRSEPKKEKYMYKKITHVHATPSRYTREGYKEIFSLPLSGFNLGVTLPRQYPELNRYTTLP